MSHTVQVPLSETDYQKIQKWAEAHKKNIGEAIADYLTDTILHANEPFITPVEIDPDVQREKAA